MSKVLSIGGLVLSAGSSLAAVGYGIVALFSSGSVFMGIAVTTFILGSTAAGIGLILGA